MSKNTTIQKKLEFYHSFLLALFKKLESDSNLFLLFLAFCLNYMYTIILQNRIKTNEKVQKIKLSCRNTTQLNILMARMIIRSYLYDRRHGHSSIQFELDLGIMNLIDFV